MLLEYIYMVYTSMEVKAGKVVEYGTVHRSVF